jgi:hypothetical protein
MSARRTRLRKDFERLLIGVLNDQAAYGEDFADTLAITRSRRSGCASLPTQRYTAKGRREPYI